MQLNQQDQWLSAFNTALKTVFARPQANRLNPAIQIESKLYSSVALTPQQRQLSGALMRVNHVGEVCAQALYAAQSLTTNNSELQKHLKTAAQEEIDHLSWGRDRLDALNTHASYLNPLWFAWAFTIGMVAGSLGGDKASLGFVVETENQVARHLDEHLQQLPDNDSQSRAVVTQMKVDELQHAQAAQNAEATLLPRPARLVMRITAKIMTTIAHYV